MSESKNTLSRPLKSTGNFYVPTDLLGRPEITELFAHYGAVGIAYYIQASIVLTNGCGRVSKGAMLGAGMQLGMNRESWQPILALMVKTGTIRYEGDFVVSDVIELDQTRANEKQAAWRDKKKAQRISSTKASDITEYDVAIARDISSDDIPF